MCGIAGLIGVDREIAGEAAPRMLRALRHRGPDGSGIVEVPQPGGPDAILIQTRLAILDPSPAGRQPMSDTPPTRGTPPNWIVYNGEVFNYRDLHPDLERAGWPCRSQCDTEAILNAYRVWGESAVERLRGMFAWCLADAERGDFWLCRDRLGIKPLYVFRPASGGLMFASEVRALLAAGPGLVPSLACPAAVESFLAQGAVFGRRSIIRGVESIPPGLSLRIDARGEEVRKTRYWSLPTCAEGEETDRPTAVASLSESLRGAVRSWLISDVPLGLFLSGGIDSGALAAVATEVSGARIRTLSIGFDDAEFDETQAAARVAATLGTEHETIRLSGGGVLDEMLDALCAMDQPTVDGFNTFFVSRAARRAGLTVALSGLGGDELFGGYASFRDVVRAERFQSAGRLLGPLAGAARGALRAAGPRAAAKAAELLGRPRAAAHRYLLRRELLLPQERRSLHELPADSDPYSGVPLPFLQELAESAEDLDPVNQVSRLELAGYMSQMLLRDSDVFSMASGLEIRVPLLDHELVEAAVRLPGRWKRPDPRPKPLLVDAVGDRLPGFLGRMPKKGFAFPWASWLRGPMQARAEAALRSREVWNSLGLDPEAPPQLWARFLEGDARVSPLGILALMTLEDFASRHGLST